MIIFYDVLIIIQLLVAITGKLCSRLSGVDGKSSSMQNESLGGEGNLLVIQTSV